MEEPIPSNSPNNTVVVSLSLERNNQNNNISNDNNNNIHNNNNLKNSSSNSNDLNSNISQPTSPINSENIFQILDSITNSLNFNKPTTTTTINNNQDLQCNNNENNNTENLILSPSTSSSSLSSSTSSLTSPVKHKSSKKPNLYVNTKNSFESNVIPLSSSSISSSSLSSSSLSSSTVSSPVSIDSIHINQQQQQQQQQLQQQQINKEIESALESISNSTISITNSKSISLPSTPTVDTSNTNTTTTNSTSTSTTSTSTTTPTSSGTGLTPTSSTTIHINSPQTSPTSSSSSLKTPISGGGLINHKKYDDAPEPSFFLSTASIGLNRLKKSGSTPRDNELSEQALLANIDNPFSSIPKHIKKYDCKGATIANPQQITTLLRSHAGNPAKLQKFYGLEKDDFLGIIFSGANGSSGGNGTSVIGTSHTTDSLPPPTSLSANSSPNPSPPSSPPQSPPLSPTLSPSVSPSWISGTSPARRLRGRAATTSSFPDSFNRQQQLNPIGGGNNQTFGFLSTPTTTNSTQTPTSPVSISSSQEYPIRLSSSTSSSFLKESPKDYHKKPKLLIAKLLKNNNNNFVLNNGTTTTTTTTTTSTPNSSKATIASTTDSKSSQQHSPKSSGHESPSSSYATTSSESTFVLSPSSKESLMALMKDKQAYDMLKQFCEKEQSLHHLLFIEEVDHLHCSPSFSNNDSAILEEIERIYNKFFVEDSICELNVEKRYVIQIQQLIKEKSTSKTIFDKVFKMIKEEITLDTFKRFCTVYSHHHNNNMVVGTTSAPTHSTIHSAAALAVPLSSSSWNGTAMNHTSPFQTPSSSPSPSSSPPFPDNSFINNPSMFFNGSPSSPQHSPRQQNTPTSSSTTTTTTTTTTIQVSSTPIVENNNNNNNNNNNTPSSPTSNNNNNNVVTINGKPSLSPRQDQQLPSHPKILPLPLSALSNTNGISSPPLSPRLSMIRPHFLKDKTPSPLSSTSPPEDLQTQTLEDLVPYGIAFGFKRGSCKAPCDCIAYTPEGDKGGACLNCGHYPAAHKNLGKISAFHTMDNNTPGTPTSSPSLPISSLSDSPSDSPSPLLQTPLQFVPQFSYLNNLDSSPLPSPKKMSSHLMNPSELRTRSDSLAVLQKMINSSHHIEFNNKERLNNSNNSIVNNSQPPQINNQQVINNNQQQQQQQQNNSNNSNNEDSDIEQIKFMNFNNWAIDGDEIVFLNKLGEGTSAKVYKATWRNQEVAVKILRSEPEHQKLLDFLKELEIMSSLRSPHVVYFYGMVLQPKICMIMEYCSNQTLYHLMHLQMDFTWDWVLKFSIEMVKGVNCLHSWKPIIVHRDLKSLNLLVSDNWTIKVADFGLSRFATTKSASIRKTRGTYAYCAPEVFYGDITPKGDIYSIGIILWELAVRCIKSKYEKPFYEFKHIQYDFQILVQTTKHNLRPTIPANCPEGFANLIVQCWDGNPDKRPTCPEILDSLLDLEKKYSENKKKWDKIREKPKLK
eukprot:gene4967-6188_t